MELILVVQSGDFDRGFAVEIHLSGSVIRATLPPAADIPQLYQQWQQQYYVLPQVRRKLRIKAVEEQVVRRSSVKECQTAARRLGDRVQAWLDELPIATLPDRPLKIVIRTDHVLLRRLPWHLWNLIETSSGTALVLDSQHTLNAQPLQAPVQVLAVFGSDEGIDLSRDRLFLQDLRYAEVRLLEKPSYRQLIETIRSQAWQVLFFAGHSYSRIPESAIASDQYHSDGRGEIHINESERISLNDLRYTLRDAARQGLQLAIFNSCDGLGLAQDAAELQIPSVIVMREPVPDEVAQEFLRAFLAELTTGKSLAQAIRRSRGLLTELYSKQYPGAGWLPILCQSAGVPEVMWPQQPALLPSRWQRVRSQIKRWHLGIISAIGIWILAGLNYGITERQYRDRMSFGDRLLVQVVTNQNKEKGIEYFRNRDYKGAIAAFEQSLKKQPNDPETRIYLNNAKVMASAEPTVAIAIGIPAKNNPEIAQEILRGAAQLQQEVNQQDTKNLKKIKFLIVSDDNNPDLAQRLAQRLVSNSEIIAVLGHNASHVSNAASREYQGKLVMISPTSFKKEWLENDDNFIFRTVPDIGATAEKLAIYAQQTTKQPLMVLCYDPRAVDNASFSREFSQRIEQRQGRVLNEMRCDFSVKNFNPDSILAQAEAAGANMMVLAPNVNHIDQALQIAAINAKRQKPLKLLASPTLYTRATLQVGQGSVGMVLAAPWHPTVAPNRLFVEEAIKLWGDRNALTWRTATAYDAAKVLAEGIRFIDQPDMRRSLQEKLTEGIAKGQPFSVVEGATGTVRFSPSGDRSGGNIVLVKVEKSSKPGQAGDENQFVALDSANSRISLGERVLITGDNQTDKAAGAIAFSQRNWAEATRFYQKAQQTKRNDPETWIYLNNIRAIATGNPLQIAATVPIGGNLNFAEDILRGIAQAQSEINDRGGIQGRLLQVKIANDDNRPEMGEAIAREFIADPKTLAVIGPNNSDVAIQAGQVYQKAGLVMITPTSTARQVSEIGRYIFRSVLSERIYGQQLARYAITTQPKARIVVCQDPQSSGSTTIVERFSEEIQRLGGQISPLTCNFSAVDFNPQRMSSQVRSEGATGLLLSPSTRKLSYAMDLTRELNRSVQLYGSVSLINPETLQLGQNAVNGMVLYTPWNAELSNNQTFLTTAKDRWGEQISWRIAMAYDATIAIATGLQNAKTRQELQQVLISPDFKAPGASGMIQFTESGDRKPSPTVGSLVTIRPVDQAPFEFDFVTLDR
jgi:branched-chain amino acid transport system substrate-binding protein